MTREFKRYTLGELEDLPVGTIFAERTAGISTTLEDVIWVKDSALTVELVSHESDNLTNSGSINIDLFATNEPTNKGLPVSALAIVGYDSSKVVHVHEDEKLRIYWNRSLRGKISPSKLAAHAVHAALTAFGVHPGIPVVVLEAGPTKIEAMRTSIHDAGHTELEPGTLTTGTEWPLDTK